jgi:hypothetical protein
MSSRTLYLDPGMYSVTASFSDNRMSQAQEVGADPGGQNSINFARPASQSRVADEELEGMDDPFAMDDTQDDDELEADRGATAESSGWSPVIFWVGAGFTVVGGVATIFSGIDTQNNPGRAKVKEACENNTTNCQDLYDEGVAKQNRTNALLGVTGGLAVFTIVAAALTDWGPSSPATAAKASKRRPGLEVDPFISVGNGAMLGATARF